MPIKPTVTVSTTEVPAAPAATATEAPAATDAEAPAATDAKGPRVRTGKVTPIPAPEGVDMQFYDVERGSNTFRCFVFCDGDEIRTIALGTSDSGTLAAAKKAYTETNNPEQKRKRAFWLSELAGNPGMENTIKRFASRDGVSL
jgi:hypothetical protein